MKKNPNIKIENYKGMPLVELTEDIQEQIILEIMPESPRWKSFIPATPETEWQMCGEECEETGETVYWKERLTDDSIPNEIRIPVDEAPRMLDGSLAEFFLYGWNLSDPSELDSGIDEEKNEIVLRRIAA